MCFVSSSTHFFHQQSMFNMIANFRSDILNQQMKDSASLITFCFYQSKISRSTQMQPPSDFENP